MDNNMLKFIEIRNSYARPKIGELSINEKALAEYEKFCLDLIKDNEHQKEIIDKIEKKVKENIRNAKYKITTLTITDKEYYKYVDNMLNDLLQILEDKEV